MIYLLGLIITLYLAVALFAVIFDTLTSGSPKETEEDKEIAEKWAKMWENGDL